MRPETDVTVDRLERGRYFVEPVQDEELRRLGRHHYRLLLNEPATDRVRRIGMIYGKLEADYICGVLNATSELVLLAQAQRVCNE